MNRSVKKRGEDILKMKFNSQFIKCLKCPLVKCVTAAARPSQTEKKRRRETSFLLHLGSSHIIYTLPISHLILLRQETAPPPWVSETVTKADQSALICIFANSIN